MRKRVIFMKPKDSYIHIENLEEKENSKPLYPCMCARVNK